MTPKIEGMMENGYTLEELGEGFSLWYDEDLETEVVIEDADPDNNRYDPEEFDYDYDQEQEESHWLTNTLRL